MNEQTKEEVSQITQQISDIYQKVFFKEGNKSGGSQCFEDDLKMLRDKLENIKSDLERKLSSLYDNGANEIDPEVNQVQREIQEINNWVEDIVPDLLVYIKENPEITGNVESTYVEQKDREYLEEITQPVSVEPVDNIEPIWENQVNEEPIQETENLAEINLDTNTQIVEEIQDTSEDIVTIKLGKPSRDYKTIAKHIIKARNISLCEPSKAIENGVFASGQVIEKIKNILLKDI